MTESHLERIESLLEPAQSTGRFGLFTISALSYYPIDRVRNLVMRNVYEVGLEDGLSQSKRYHERKREKKFLIDLNQPLRGASIEGTFLYLLDGETERGFLDIKHIDCGEPRVNLSIISANALFPHTHQIESVGIPVSAPSPNYKTTFYTVDQDGSKWSIHCRK